MTLNLADDYLIFDNPVTVAVRDVDTAAEVSVASVIRRELTTREIAASNGKYLTGDVRYSIPQTLYADSPKVGDKIVESDGSLWTVLTVSKSTLASRWPCVTRNLVIAGGLTEAVDIEQMTVSKGTHGEAVATWNVIQSGVSARLQPTDNVIGEDRNRRTTSYRAKIYFAEYFALDDSHRIVRNGEYWTVQGGSKPERIDELYEVDATRDPFPL